MRCFRAVLAENMDILNAFEIYIPELAEVKTIPLWSLPDSMLRRMSLPQADCKASRTRKHSPQGTWISPVIIRKRGHTENCEKASMCSLLSSKLCTAQGPFRMSFVSASHTAYKLLSEMLPETKVSAHAARTSVIPKGSTPQIQQDSVVIYRGRVYLTIKKPHQLQHLGETPAVSQSQSDDSPVPTTSASSAQSQRKRGSAQMSPQSRDTGSKKRRSRVTPEQQEDPSTTTDHHSTATDCPATATDHPTTATDHPTTATNCHPTTTDRHSTTTDRHSTTTDRHSTTTDRHSSTDQGMMLNDDLSKKEDAMCKVPHAISRNDVMMGGGDASSPETAHPVPASGDSSVDCDRHAGEALSGAADPAGAHESSGTENDEAAGVTELRGEQSWSSRDSLPAEFVFTSPHQQFDFNELEQEESIARMKAKLLQSEAALHKLQSSK